MANRKLQGEIERVLKKVDEGVQVFEQIWDKVYGATTTAQKEKYEGDLKKEIKKLQRLRDQIKTWQGDSSIKDKTKLDSNRKLIEEKMEKFKICEKETKTKAFSKEGLAQDRTDPKKKAKDAVGKWVRDAMQKLREQSEELEAEIEALNSGKRKKRGEENPLVTQVKVHISRHEHHQGMLERVLRAVDNDAVTPEETTDLKDYVDYYIESNQDPDFFEDEGMYDALNLDAAPAPTSKKSKSKERDTQDEEEDTSNHASNHKKAAAPASPRNTRGGRSATSAAPTSTAPTSTARTTALSAATTRTSPKMSRDDHSPILLTPHSPRNSAPSALLRDTIAARNGSAPLLSSVVKGAAVATTAAKVSTPTPIPVTSIDIGKTHPNAQTVIPDSFSHGLPASTSTIPRVQRAPVGTTQEDAAQQYVVTKQSVAPANGPIAPRSGGVVDPAQTTQAIEKLSNNADPTLVELESALTFMPETAPRPAPKSMSVRPPVSQAPRNPVKVPPTFPSFPSPVFDNRKVFEQFDPDTLFFIFYYQQGTYQQYLAAAELKRQGWRFHKKYLTWFQRHDDPKHSTQEFETGTFIYFDYANVVVRGEGTGWCQRIKSEFVFEYRFLEDELPV